MKYFFERKIKQAEILLQIFQDWNLEKIDRYQLIKPMLHELMMQVRVPGGGGGGVAEDGGALPGPSTQAHTPHLHQAACLCQVITYSYRYQFSGGQ